jgi:hypothetical protein
MRENRTYGSEGGEAKNLPYPYQVRNYEGWYYLPGSIVTNCRWTLQLRPRHPILAPLGHAAEPGSRNQMHPKALVWDHRPAFSRQR